MTPTAGGNGNGRTRLSPERWQQLNAIVDEALDRDAADRPAFLDTACDGDPLLRSDVERFLQACAESEDFLEAPALELVAPLRAAVQGGSDEVSPAMPAAGARIGPYRIVREIGRGGMGAVYLAERDDQQYRRRVALKLARAGLPFAGDGHMARRLVEERQILASLEHPDIARLLDGGVTGEGTPWFAMEYVEGTPIDRYCDAHALSVEARLLLFCRVCDAVAYAHRNLVVHRDLKPSNIMVTQSGDVRLLDFGIARLLAPGESGLEAETQTMMRALTPEYASPEQIRGERALTPSDVYSLGVLLYELLAGRRPYADETRTRHALERAILEHEPERPSIAVLRLPALVTDHALDLAPRTRVPPAAVAAARSSTAEKLSRRLRGDLDTIVLMAMRKEPERRYASADQLADDVRRHLSGQPVSARPDTRTYRTLTFVRRHRAAVIGAIAFVATCIGFSIVTALQSGHIRAQAGQIVQERDKAQAVSSFLTDLFMAADPFMGTGREPSVREVLDSGAARVERSLSDQPGIRAELLEVIATSYLSLGRQNDARRLLEEALRLRPMEAREGEPHYLSVQRALAAVAQEQGDWQVAERLYGDLVNERRRILGPKSNVLARTLNSQAKLLSAMGRDREAEPLLREALAIDSILMDPHHLSQSFNNLGNVLIAEGRYDAAEGMHRRAYLLRHTALGDSSAETGNSLVRLAVTRAEQGDPADADSLIRQGIAIKRRVLGPLHPDVLDDERTYGRVLQRIGRLAEAEVVYRGALEHGVARPDLVLWRAEVLAGLGGVILDRGDAQRARPVLQQAFEMQSKLLPPQHWKRAMTERALGVCLARLGNTSAAEPLLAEALTILESSRGYDDARSVRVRKELAALRAGQ